MNYKFADKVFNIKSLYDSFSIFAKEYICDDKEDYIINVNQSDLDEWLNNHPEDKKYPLQYIETLIIHKLIAEKVSDNHIYIIHGSSILVKGKGYIFIAPSGVGKSTHVRLLKQKLNNQIIYINDDKPFINNNFDIYGSPWDGKERLSNNVKAHLNGVFILKRGITPSYRKLSPKESVKALYQSIYITNEEQVLDYIIRLTSHLPIYEICVNMENESIDQTIKLMEQINYEN